MYFSMAQSVLSLLFHMFPPKCRVFLLTDFDMSNPDNWICYRPEELENERPGMLSTISSSLLDTFFPAYPHELPTSKHDSSSQVTSAGEAPSTAACELKE